MHLTVIAKRPVPGLVKTRLCPPCTPEQAAAVATAALGDTLDAIDAVVDACGGRVEPVLLFEGDPSGWARPGWRVVAQRGDGLAQRLANAYDELGAGVIVGMEVPHAVPRLASELGSLRRGVDLLGLAVDGGYWMIGLHSVDRKLFDDVPMSRTNTGLRQLSRLHRSGRSVRLLRAEHDLDTFDDLVVAGRRNEPTRLGELARQLTPAPG